MTDIVNALITRDRKLLLVRRSPLRANYPDCWSFPGGHVEPGESLETALIREIQEELAITPIDYAPFTTLQDPATPTITYHFFRVTRWSGGSPILTGDEHTEMTWLTPTQACRLNGLALPGYQIIFNDLA